ncbi:MAG: hypothetical protein JWO86_3093 [Myxococcaceae bacterium]|nr:hypothetical protein [Myxococcaceae bacterium]
MIRFSMWRPLAATCISVLASTLYACSGAGDGAGSSASASTDSALEIHFDKMYSAFDGQHDFKIPAVVTGVTKVNWSVSDPSIASIEKQSDGSAIITVLGAGTVDIIAKAGSVVGKAPLTITESMDNEWEAGNQRYNNGTVLTRPTKGDQGDGGGGGGMGGGGGAFKDKQLSCTNCHGSGADKGSGDIEHTPTQTAGYSDDELITIFTKGVKPAGVPQRVMMNKAAWNKLHQWQMDEYSVKGIVVYLRSLEPKSQGSVDFGGRGPKGNQKPATDTSGSSDSASDAGVN